MTQVKTVLDKYMDLIDYAIYHAPLLRNHKEFGERMRDVRFEIGSIEENYQRVLLAAKGRGMVSEMLNMEEAVVLVCGLHDKVLRLEASIIDMSLSMKAAQQSMQPTKSRWALFLDKLSATFCGQREK